jgi:hypothetical protein
MIADDPSTQLCADALPGWVTAATQRAIALWYRCDDTRPLVLRSVSRERQRANDRQLDAHTDALLDTWSRMPTTEQERQDVQARSLEAVAHLLSAALDWGPPQMELLFGRGLPEVGVTFARQARAFDADISGAAIFQAGRNVWTANGLQLLLGLPLALTPAMVGYSLLYPYTDNYLDDPAISPRAKAAFDARFARRLAGEPVPPADDHEGLIWRLVEMIEGQHPRAARPGVYQSLLAIHAAQHKSLRLLRPAALPYDLDVLAISIEKGGASVLADGFLVAGDLTAPQAEAFFNYGAFAATGGRLAGRGPGSGRRHDDDLLAIGRPL